MAGIRVSAAVAVAVLIGLATNVAAARADLAAQQVSGSTAMFGVACPTASMCLAVGEDGGEGVLAQIVDGVPGAAAAVPGAGPLDGIACESATTCDAVGGTLSGGTVVVPIVNGVPQAAQPIPSVGAGLNDVACENTTICIAVGRSTYPGGIGDVVPIVNGVAAAVQQVANTSILLDVACEDSSDCTAVGVNLSPPSGTTGGELGETVPISGTTAGSASPIDGTDGVDSIGCPANSGACVGGAEVYEQSPEVLSFSGGSFGGATPDSDFGLINGVACPAAGTCFAVGFASGSGGGEVALVTNGSPGAGQPVSGSYDLVHAACGPGGNCEAVGWGSDNNPPGVAVQLSNSCPVSTGALRAHISGTAPTLTLGAGPVNVDPANGGTLTVTATIAAQCPLNPAELQLDLTPSLNFSNPAQFNAFTGQQATVTQNFTVGGGQTVQQTFNGLTVSPVVVNDGFTIHGMNTWTSDGWQGTQPTSVTLGGGRLVYSDSPEYVAATTTVETTKGHKPGGDAVEGVLYREQGHTDAAGASGGDFRVYLNHENRTNETKSICIVMTNPDPHLVSQVVVTKLFSGKSQNGGDPVKAGRLALVAWENARRNPSSTTHRIFGGKGAWTDCIATLGPGKGKTGPVVNAIIDFRANGRVQVGVVVVDTRRVKSFEKDPLTFKFADGAHPNGDPFRTLEHNGSLANSGESHVRGTYDYDQEDVTLPAYNLDSNTRYGVLLARDPSSESSQYQAALDTGAINKGNYGVLYQVTAAVTGSTGEQAQVLLNPRAVGRPPGKSYVNGFAGVADVPATPLGNVIPIPDPSDPNLTNGSSNLTDNDLGVGIGQVQANNTFSFAFMPPGGAALPLAVVLAPAFIQANATLTYDQGTSNAGTVTAGPTIIPLDPSGS